MPLVPDLSSRAVLREMMDDFSISDRRLERALVELRQVNRLLGGSRAILRELKPILARRKGGSLKVLDVGTGLADIPERIVMLGEQCGVRVSVTAIDANPATVAFARKSLDARTKPELRKRIDVRTGDVFHLSTNDGEFDVAIASHFLHHFYGEDAIRILREMNRVASEGVIINDLHRRWLAYAAIQGISKIMPVSAMFGHDGPASVRRGFTEPELRDLASKAGLRGYHVRRYWAYRLTLSTLAT